MGADLQGGEGSLWDRLFLAVFLVLALAVCLHRRIEWSRLLRDNWWVILLFLYLGASILWVETPFVSLKRWIKSAGPVVMALLVLSEKDPLEALGSILRRCAYILIPISVVLIKYYPALGRAFHPWTGVEMWTGVATHKNSLGQLCAVSAFFFIWSLLRKGRSGESVKTGVPVYADMFVLAVAIYVLIGPGQGGYSATSVAILLVGVTTFLVLSRLQRLARFVGANIKGVVITLVLSWWLFADATMAAVSGMFGRNANLTGRATEIWPIVLAAAARHPLLGAGYGGVWGLGGTLTSQVGVEQAHNGYLDVYLDLGIVGLVFLTAFLINFCGRIRREFSHDFDWGLFGLCFLLMTLVYNLDESAFFDVYLGAAMVLVTMVFSVSLQPTRQHAAASGVQRTDERLSVAVHVASRRQLGRFPRPSTLRTVK